MTIEELAVKAVAANPGSRFAIAKNKSAIAIFDEGKGRFVPIIEATINGGFVYASVNVPREWDEVTKRLAPEPLPIGL